MLSATDSSLFNFATVYIRFARWLLGPLYMMMVLALYGVFLYAPTEKEMGEVQRIFYFHVGAAWNAFLAFFIVFLSGVIYLIVRKKKWDHLAAASAEVGVIFTTIVLCTGPIWAKPVWNTWWPWGDPRVMTTLVLWLIYVSYLILRTSLPDGEKKYKYCAVFGIIGFLDVPIVWFSIRLWRTIHPVVITKSGAQLEPEMTQVLMLSVATFTLFYIVLVAIGVALRLNASLLDELTQKVLDSRIKQV